MKILYFDCFAGVSGDMTVGALLDLGVEPERLWAELLKLKLSGYEIRQSKVVKSDVSANRFEVFLTNSGDEKLADEDFIESNESGVSAWPTHPVENHHPEHRPLSNILALIDQSHLSSQVKAKSTAIFERLGKAESKVHAIPFEQVEFHEVGGLDAIIDIVSARS